MINLIFCADQERPIEELSGHDGPEIGRELGHDVLPQIGRESGVCVHEAAANHVGRQLLGREQ